MLLLTSPDGTWHFGMAANQGTVFCLHNPDHFVLSHGFLILNSCPRLFHFYLPMYKSLLFIDFFFLIDSGPFPPLLGLILSPNFGLQRILSPFSLVSSQIL